MAGSAIPVDAVMTQVAESFAQDSTGWLHQAIPMIDTLDYRNGVESLTYNVPDLSNALQRGGALHDWRHGQNRGQPIELGKGTVTINPKGKETDVLQFATDRGQEHVFADARNDARLHMVKAFTGLDKLVSGPMTDPAIFTQQSWTGTGKLSDYASDQVPHKDIQDAVRPLRVWHGMANLTLEAYLGEEIARILAGYTEYTGAGVGSAIAKNLDLDNFAQVFARQHGFDQVHIIRKTEDTAVEGLARAYSRVFDNIFIGLMDRTQSRYTVRPDSSMRGPGGSLAIGFGLEPMVDVWEQPGTKMTSSSAIMTVDVIRPHEQAESLTMGVFWPTNLLV